MKFGRIIICLLVMVSLFYFINDTIAYKYEGIKIKKIVINGIVNADESKSFDVLEVSDGEPFIAKRASESIKNLYKLGYFSDVKLDVVQEQDGLILTFFVKERPVVKDIVFKGNDEFSDSDLNEALKDIIKEGDIYQETKVNDAVNLIMNKYEEEGYNDITIRALPIINKEKKTCKIIFRIREGDKVRVSKISIKGCKSFTEKKIIGKMDTHIDDWLHSGIFKRDEYEKDKENIIKFYKNNGYIYARIVKDGLIYRIEGDRGDKEKRLYITIVIDEGKQYKFGGYNVTGYYIFSKDEIIDVLEHKTNEVFEQEQFEKDMQGLHQLYGNRGYIFVRIIPDRKVDEKKRVVKYDISISEGEIAHLEQIIIKGNTKTKDYVIRRELLIHEGEIFNAHKIQRSQEKVYNLGFFKKVNIDVKPGSAEGLMNLIFDIEEQPTGMITLGAVWGSVDGLGGYEEVSENNFRGEGIRLHERVEYQQKKQNYEVGFTHPWIFGTPTSFSFSLFYRNRADILTPSINSNENSYYNKQEWGGSLGLGRIISDVMSISALYNLELYKYYNFRGTPSDVNLQDKINAGDFVKSSLTLKYNYDSRDNIFNPTKGLHFTQSWELTGGILGGDDKYMKYITEVSKYFPVIWKLVMALHFNYGLIDRSFDGKPIDKTINSDDLLYVGGVDSVRGYEYWEVGKWKYGGFSRIYGNFEFRLPIAEDLLWFVLFCDAGNTWPRSHLANFDYREYNYSTGFGFRIQIPMMPIRLYFPKKFYYDRTHSKWILEDKGILGWDFAFSVGGLF